MLKIIKFYLLKHFVCVCVFFSSRSIPGIRGKVYFVIIEYFPRISIIRKHVWNFLRISTEDWNDSNKFLLRTTSQDQRMLQSLVIKDASKFNEQFKLFIALNLFKLINHNILTILLFSNSTGLLNKTCALICSSICDALNSTEKIIQNKKTPFDRKFAVKSQ